MKFIDLYQELILEKDHRQKMVKFGIPEDVAQYLHDFNDKFSIWFANQIKNMQGFQNSNSKINWINANLQTDMRGIIDWVQNMPNIQLKSYNWDEAVAAHKNFHENIQTKTVEGEENNKILKKYKDGFYWVDLETNSRCEEEKSLMGHCATTDAETLYSLRRFDSGRGIEAFVTIGASPTEGVWRQAKGKRNSKPKDEYFKYIADILVRSGMLKYKTEYDSPNDFDASDLKEYVEANPEQFDDPDTILMQIEEENTSFDDFVEKLDQSDFKELKYFSTYLDVDDNYVMHSIYFHFPIKLDIFKEYAFNVAEYITNRDFDDTLEAKDLLHDIFGHVYSFNYGRIEVQDDEIVFGGDLNDEDDVSTLDDSGLENFENILNYYEGEESYINSRAKNDFIEKFIDHLVEKGIIPDPEDTDPEERIEPKYPEDPRQMKFDFANENYFSQLFQELS